MRPAHHSPDKVQGAIDVIVLGGIKGGCYGFLSGVAFHFAAQRWSPRYRGLTIQFRTFIQVAFVITGACWVIDKNLLEYERKVSREQRELRIKKLEDSVQSGEYTYMSQKIANKIKKDRAANEQIPEPAATSLQDAPQSTDAASSN